MMQTITFVVLLVLACARVPALRRNGRDDVFVAALLSAAAMGLNIDGVYLALDPLLGGRNFLNLIIHTLLIVGLWFLRICILQAVAPAEEQRSNHLLPLLAVLALQVALFSISDVPVSASDFALTYGDQFSAALYSGCTMLYIAWVGAELGLRCFRHLPAMKGAFKTGFRFFIGGCTAAFVSASSHILTVVVDHADSAQYLIDALSDLYKASQAVTVVGLGTGLTIAALSGSRMRKREAHYQDSTLEKLSAIWSRVVVQGSFRQLPMLESAPSHERIHRLLVEIRDAELAAGPDVRLLSEDESLFVEEVETRSAAAHR